jgi:UDPglucose--hexose-1-phosphate uridylyltransferase
VTDAPKPQRRLNILTGDWVLVSPHRISRPWQGAEEAAKQPPAPKHDPHCHLCAGNTRASGVVNPDYAGVYIFDNDYPALLAEGGPAEASSDGVLVAEPEFGVCRVICYSPDHSLTMAGMSTPAIRAVVDAWAEQTVELAARPDIGAVTLFENRGEMMGASSPHPHGQLWATASVPNELANEDARQRAYLAKHGEPMLTAYLRRELEEEVRVVCANDGFVAVVPYWASWPFETLVLPRRSVSSLDRLTLAERDALADLFGRLTRGYDAVFAAPFPYSMGFHQRPMDGDGTEDGDDAHFTLHAHFYPPLLRSASIRKFMVGFEMLAMPQRDMTPEAAAARLREVIR